MIDVTRPKGGRKIMLSTVLYRSGEWKHKWMCPGQKCPRKRDVVKPYDKRRDQWIRDDEFLCDECRR